MKVDRALKIIENCVKEEIEFSIAAGDPEDPEIRKAHIKNCKKAFRIIKQAVLDYEKSWRINA